jgi:hypothetical protein
MSLALTLVDSGCFVTYLGGEADLLADFIAKLQEVSKRQAFGPWEGWCKCYEGCLLLLEGKHGEAVNALQDGLWRVSKTHWVLRNCMFVAALGECLISVGESAAALRVLEQGLEDIDRTGELWALPELLRVKASAVRAMGGPTNEVEDLLHKSIGFASQKKMLSWELRSSVHLADIFAERGEQILARGLLQKVLGRFSEGHARPDLKNARERILRLSAGT